MKSKIKESFHHALKRALSKRSLKVLSFDDHLALLEALPRLTGTSDDLSMKRDAGVQKSL